jgi:hypothetical protein
VNTYPFDTECKEIHWKHNCDPWYVGDSASNRHGSFITGNAEILIFLVKDNFIGVLNQPVISDFIFIKIIHYFIHTMNNSVFPSQLY